jgi:glutaredoxin 3
MPGTVRARVEIYTDFFCGHSARAKRLLDAKGVAYEELDVMAQPGRRAEMAERSGGRESVPQIFIDGVHVGGAEDLEALDAAGELDGLLGGGE